MINALHLFYKTGDRDVEIMTGFDMVIMTTGDYHPRAGRLHKNCHPRAG